jgi:signal recognition particle GTPase
VVGLVWSGCLQLEEVLMMADIGAATTSEILDDLKAVAKEDQLDPEDVKSVLRGRLIDALSVKDRRLQITKEAANAASDEKVRARGESEPFFLPPCRGSLTERSSD